MLRLAASTAALAIACTSAQAQQLGYSGQVVLPVVAQTASCTSTIYIHNPGSIAFTVFSTFQGATTGATPGAVGCSNVDVAPGGVVKITLAALCPALNAGSNFGTLNTSGYGSGYTMYTRVETPGGNGFSIEGVVADCCYALAEVIGLRRQAAYPVYQSNCFIYNRETRLGRIVVTLANGDGVLIGTRIIDLQPSEFIRLLDVLAEVNAAPGDYDNVRAQFTSIAPLAGGQAVAYSASCTVQNNTSFDADFRIAKGHY